MAGRHQRPCRTRSAWRRASPRTDSFVASSARSPRQRCREDRHVIAFLFPGQGSQKVGMGQALADAFVEARATFDEADAAFAASCQESGREQPRRFSDLIFQGPEDQLTLTEFAQPAILT